MQRERVAEDIYVFTSEKYVQVTAGVVLTSEGAVLIDTLLFPDETRAIKQFVEGRLGVPVRYVINSHYHADHTYGTCQFPGAIVVAHQRCADLLHTRGRAGLAQDRASVPELVNVEIVMPHVVFDNQVMSLQIGGKVFQMWHSPGHSPDSIVCLVREDRVLFAADTLMGLPYFVDGDYEDFLNSLRALQHNNYENIVQGHGEIVLRGEIEARIQSDLRYLAELRRYVEIARSKANPEAYLDQVEIERCGKNRVILAGYARQLHRANLHMLYNTSSAGQPVEQRDDSAAADR